MHLHLESHSRQIIVFQKKINKTHQINQSFPKQYPKVYFVFNILNTKYLNFVPWIEFVLWSIPDHSRLIFSLCKNNDSCHLLIINSGSDYSWLCAQGSLLAVFGEPYIQPTALKSSSLSPPILS